MLFDNHVSFILMLWIKYFSFFFSMQSAIGILVNLFRSLTLGPFFAI